MNRLLVATLALSAFASSSMGCANAHSSTAPKAESPAGATTAAAQTAVSTAPIALRVTPIALPGSPERVTMDYLAYDVATKALWVPAGNTKRVDVIDTSTNAVAEVPGFASAQHEAHGVIRYLGPSSATIGEGGIVFVGNRGDSKVCAIDGRAKTIGSCVTLLTPPDGIAYVAATKEIWVTTPRDKTITIVDASNLTALKVAVAIPVDGKPEGYAVDDAHGIFYTNLEDKDRTLAIDVRARTVHATWNPGCGEEGPRGLAYDAARAHLYVVCTDRLLTMDARDGKVLGSLATGGGVDNIDYAAKTSRVFVASGKDGKLVVALAGDSGALTKIGEAPTAEGARVVVADGEARAFVADSAHGRILLVEPSR